MIRIGTAELHNCDCLEFMRGLPDKAFDLAIVDPPYFEGPNYPGFFGSGNSSLGVARGRYYGPCKKWMVPKEDYFMELKRVSVNQIIWGANHFSGRFDSSSPSWIVWDKDNGASTFADAELAYSSFNTAVRIFKYRWNGMIQADMKNKETRIHPTQKPSRLYEWLLTNYAKPGQRILDTHLGSMSSVIACLNMGFEIVGCELDEDYFKAGVKRVHDSQKQQRMNFEVAV